MLIRFLRQSFSACSLTRSQVLFRSHSQTTTLATNTAPKLSKMPVKKDTASKRKAALAKSPSVSDPFTAAKKAKKNITPDDDAPPAPAPEVTEPAASAAAVTEIENEEVEKNPKREVKASAKTASKKKKSDDDDGAEDDCGPETSVKYKKEDFKAASNGKEYNFKIVSWNLNGIRAWLEKDGIEYLKAEEPDIFCCQETKCDKSKIPIKAEMPNYHSYWLSGDTQGYSGVGLLTKVKPIKVTFGINNKKFDNEGRVICAEYEKFFLINTYIPNSSQGLVRLPFRMEWETEFRKFLADLEKQKPIIWCGDLNVAHHRIDIRNPDSNLRSAGFTVEERDCFTKVLDEGYFDSFRYLYPERVGYTYWSYRRNSRANNVGWRLDYFVLSEKLKPNLVDNLIRDKVMGSDHCPIALCLNI